MNSQAPQSQPPASSRKGTFTDDLHKLVDNWARDAMNLSGKKSSKGHNNYEVSSCPVLMLWITGESLAVTFIYPVRHVGHTNLCNRRICFMRKLMKQYQGTEQTLKRILC